jgi:hypothetical protein
MRVLFLPAELLFHWGSREMISFGALASSICHARVTVSGIHGCNEKQLGFPIKIASKVTIYESINLDIVAKSVNTLHFVITTRGRNLAFTTGYKISPCRSR